MTVKLISSIQIAEGEFPSLQLPVPDGFNNGGYKIPAIEFGKLVSSDAYSPIDLLCAALESMLNAEVVDNLTTYYDKHRILMSFHDVCLTYREAHGGIRYMSIAQIRDIIKKTKNEKLQKVMVDNAPLCFKWKE